MNKRIFLIILISSWFCLLHSQVRIRILTEENPDHLLLNIVSGSYIIDCPGGKPLKIQAGETMIITRYGDRIGVKCRNVKGFQVDSVFLRGVTGSDRFSVRTIGSMTFSKQYPGNLDCYPDLGALLLINTCDIEQYIAGVVKSEGGSGKNEEYFRTQAVIARTYTYRYFEKHLLDRFNLCDDTHCQAFDGLTADTLINKAVLHTRGLVIVTPDSNLIISAFHSNCGGETSPSEYIWFASQPYLIKVTDPYCSNSRNASWERRLSFKEWIGMLEKNGYRGPADDPALFDFDQPARVREYVSGTFTIPFRQIRAGLNLRSSWFSVIAEGDSVLLKGKGYGHGVGLCQEGAMVMAADGAGYEQIIRFYYPGVNIIKIDDAKKLTKKENLREIETAF